MMRVRGLACGLVIVLCAIVVALGITGAPAAQAALSYPYSGVSFGPDGLGSGTFGDVKSVAVDQSNGDVYVFDEATHAIYKFNAAGEPVNFSSTATNAIDGVTGQGPGAEEQIAVDGSAGPDKGDIYLANNVNVQIYSAAGTNIGEITGGQRSEGEEACGVAVDPAGAVYVGFDPSTVDKFVPSANPVTDAQYAGALFGVANVCNVAADGQGNLYAAAYNGGVSKYEASQFNMLGTEAIGTPIDVGQGNTLAVDPSAGGDVYIGERQDVATYGATGSPLARLGASASPGAIKNSYGVAVNSKTKQVYVDAGEVQGASFHRVEIFDPAIVLPDASITSITGLAAKTVTLHGAVDADGAGEASCAFEYGIGETYEHTTPCSPASIASNAGSVSVQANLTGLAPDATHYRYRLAATNANGTNYSEIGEFLTNGPTVDDESVASVSADGVELRALIDPRGIDTSYYFQYGPTSAHGSTIPAPPGNDIGSGELDRSVVQRLEGLAPNSTYHFSVVTIQGGEVSVGEDRSFTTSTGPSSFELPDGRAWEMVSPPHKFAAQVVPPEREGGALQAAADGHAFTYLADAPIEENPTGNPTLTQVFSERTPAGWSSQGISPPRETSIRIGTGQADHFFSSDLSSAISKPGIGEGSPLAPGVPDEIKEDIYSYATGSGVYTPLVTGVEPYPEPVGEVSKVLEFQYASRDARHVVFSSSLPLTPEALLAPGTSANLYEWSEGSLRLVNVLPDGTPTDGDAQLGTERERINTVSDDGSLVIWTNAENGSGGPIYVRDFATNKTLAVDAPQGGTGEAGEGVYRMASTDGRRVFFTDKAELRPDSKGTDLYEFDTETGLLTNVTPDSGDFSGAQVEVVIGIDETGTSVYFTARGALAEGATTGKVNLYMSHLQGSNWTTSFIATVSEKDFLNINRNNSQNLPREDIAARVSPNGKYLAFTSSQSLTGYDNHDLSSGLPDEEVYLYDAETQHLLCASCKPTGERPSGVIVPDNARIDPIGAREGSAVAALVPGWFDMSVLQPYYQARYLSNRGRLFFDSVDALVPHDSDGQADVYEFEPEGVGNCTSATQSGSTLFVGQLEGHAVDGCVGLISSGSSTRESIFLDASEDGSNVFFMTNAKLSATDIDEVSDVYDARECSSVSPCIAQPAVQPPACATAEACRAAPAPQPGIFGPPPSATFDGAGNLAPGSSSGTVAQIKKKVKPLTRSQKLAKALRVCKRKAKPKRASCQARARKRYGAVKPRKSNRRAGR